MSKFVIYLGEILKNLNSIKSAIKKTKICAVVKANAYGFGYKKICYLLRNSVDYFAVSCLKEFLDYKELEINVPCLILSPLNKKDMLVAIENGAEITLTSVESLKCAQEIAKKKNRRVNAHLKLDTGLSRYGISDVQHLNRFLEALKNSNRVELIGVYSHALDGYNEKQTNLQIENFKRSIEIIRSKGYNPIKHFASTSLLNTKESLFDMVRIGFGLYYQNDKSNHRLESSIVEIKTLKKGQSVGYKSEFKAKKQTQIAICAIGYADGIPRNIVKHGYVLIKGVKCKVVAIFMDSIAVNIGDNSFINVGDSVVFFGNIDQHRLSVCEMALNCDTIPYEIYSRISSRVKRIYKWRKNAGYNRKVSSKKT